MPKTFVISLLLGFLISPAIAGVTVHIDSKTKTLARPISEVLGVRLSMSQKDAHARLKKRGSLQKEARKRQEVWAVNDGRVSHVIVGFDHANYGHMAVMPPAVRQALSRDFA